MTLELSLIDGSASAPHVPAKAFAHTAGATKPKILIVGEAFGENEELYRQPFVGESGKELFRMLGEALADVEPELHSSICADMKYGFAWLGRRNEWFEAAGIALTNVLALRPPNNNLETLCGNKKEVGGEAYLYPPLTKGKYLLPEYLSELDRLGEEIETLRPNLLLALGNTACWALLRATNISSIRGSIARSAADTPGNGVKVLPSYHPAGVLRQWAWRPIAVADFIKARREAEFPEIKRPERHILINPTLSQITDWFNIVWMSGTQWGIPTLVAADTETEAGQITCISFASSASEAIVIPIWDKTKPGWSYWTEEEEIQVWNEIQSFVENPEIELLWQNGMYDYQYCLPMKLRVHRSTHDTMLLHHSLYPELNKGLGFLGSLYTNEASWKLMRRAKADTEKRDE